MRRIVFRSFITFIVLLVVTKLMIEEFNTPFGVINFFDKHGILFLIFISIFPRLTLLFSSVVSGGITWWLGFIFCPRILVATLATFAYFKTNPVLVVISWLVALSGESFEKWKLGSNRVIFRRVHVPPRFYEESEPINSEKPHIHDKNTFEAEFKRKS